MDIDRPDIAKAKRRRRILWLITVMVLLCGATVAVSRLEPAAPAVEKSAVVSDAVKRGEFHRQVRGSGTLVPEEILWIPTRSQGRVEAIRVLPGAEVKADTVLVELSNPELTQAVLELEWQLKAAEAENEKTRLELENQKLNLEASVAALKAQLTEAEFDAEIDEDLAAEGFISNFTKRRSRANADVLEKQYDIEAKRLAIRGKLVTAQIAAEEAKIAQLRGQLELKRQLVASLHIRAGIDGVLQKLGNGDPIQVGQQLQVGANVARVAIPTRLMAEIKVPETQVKDVQSGQTVSVDTRNGVVQGRVSRIDPAVVSGTVTVDVTLEGPLPKGARPDLSVDGTIELETVADVLYVGRPVQGQAESDLSIFKMTEDGKEAVRVQVKLGRSSVNYIEVREGLSAGDRIILSDMSQWDVYDRVRLK
jgi:HlyD family secretion protein